MSYLGSRTQYVQIESQISEEIECGDYGATQGSVLAGLFHLINSNDFPACHDEGQAVIYVDDETECVSDNDPELLAHKITIEAGLSTQWLKDNKLCVAPDKTKVLITGTQQLRSKLGDEDCVRIEVDNNIITESKSEKLLGLVVNNELTWKTHLYGDKINKGLLSQLSQRVGMLKALARYMDKDKLKIFVNGIFYSKLSYCFPVFGNVFGMDRYKQENRRYLSFTMRDNKKLQALQNSVNRILLNADRHT